MTSCCIYLKKKTPSFSWTSNSSSPARATCLGPPTPHQHTSAISPTRLDIFKNKLCRNWNRFEQVLLLIHLCVQRIPSIFGIRRYQISSIIINYHQLSSIIINYPWFSVVQRCPKRLFLCQVALSVAPARPWPGLEPGASSDPKRVVARSTAEHTVHYPWFVRSWTNSGKTGKARHNMA